MGFAPSPKPLPMRGGKEWGIITAKAADDARVAGWEKISNEGVGRG